jgi:NitT/TauT family transport system substrate-binding protein
MCNLIQRGLRGGLGGTSLDRRSFLRATAAATLTLAVAPSFLGGRALAAGQTLTATHGAGMCNMNIILSSVIHSVQDEGVDLQLITTPTFADEITMIGAGQIDAGVMPYTTFLALVDAGVPVKIVGGGGINGVGLVAQPGLDSPEKWKGKTLGTFQLDTLEMLAYDWMKKHGVKYSDLNIRYFDTTPESAEAFSSGAVDILTTIEPYGTILPHDKPGTVVLSDGTDIYGDHYTDCVLGVRAGLIEENPGAIKALIKGMMKAQLMAESDPSGTLDKVLGTYYKTSKDMATIAMSKQISVVDARNQADFILDRGQTLLEMNYIKKKPDASVMDWTLLEQVIAENPDLYGQLKHKSV